MNCSLSMKKSAWALLGVLGVLFIGFFFVYQSNLNVGLSPSSKNNIGTIPSIGAIQLQCMTSSQPQIVTGQGSGRSVIRICYQGSGGPSVKNPCEYVDSLGTHVDIEITAQEARTEAQQKALANCNAALNAIQFSCPSQMTCPSGGTSECPLNVQTGQCGIVGEGFAWADKYVGSCGAYGEYKDYECTAIAEADAQGDKIGSCGGCAEH